MEFRLFQIDHYQMLADRATDPELKARYESEVFHFKVRLKNLEIGKEVVDGIFKNIF